MHNIGADILKFLMSDVMTKLIMPLGIPLLTFFIGYYAPALLKRPDLFVSHQNRSTVRSGIESRNVDTNSVVYGEYKAKLHGDSEFKYSFVCASGKDPGYADIVFTLLNHGKAQAVIDGFAIFVKDFQPVNELDYSLYKKGILANPDQYVIFYSSIDPVIQRSESHPVKISEGKIKVSKESNLRISPEEYRTYYMRLAFTNYGVYKLKARVYYHCKEKSWYADVKDYIYILYDNLDEKQIAQKTN